MQMAIDVGGFSPGEADMLRQAMGSKRSHERMERLHQRFADGAAARGVAGRRHRDHLGEAGRLRQLRLPREPLGELRLPRLRVVVAEALVPGGVLRRAARRPADGLLLARTPSCRTPAATASRSAPPTSTRPPPPPPWSPRCAALGVGRIRVSRIALSRAAPQLATVWGKARAGGGAGGRGGGRGRRCGSGSPTCGGSADDLADGDRGRAALRRPGGPGPPGVAHAAAARGAGHRRAFDCFGMSRREAIWAAGAVAQVGTDRHGAQRLPGIVTGVDARRRCRR